MHDLGQQVVHDGVVGQRGAEHARGRGRDGSQDGEVRGGRGRRAARGRPVRSTVPVDPSPRGLAAARPALGRFEAELTPTWLHLACTLGGHRPPDLPATLRYAYLGARLGVTPAVVAAVHPDADVWGWSPRPAEVEAMRPWWGRSGCNLSLHERPGVPGDLGGRPTDIVIVTGVLDGMALADRRAVLAAIDRDLRPGGLLCLTYRTTVAWIEIAPLNGSSADWLDRPGAAGPRCRHRGAGAAHRPTATAGLATSSTDRPWRRGWRTVLATDPLALAEEHLAVDLWPLSHARLAEALARPRMHLRRRRPARSTTWPRRADRPDRRSWTRPAQGLVREALRDLADEALDEDRPLPARRRHRSTAPTGPTACRPSTSSTSRRTCSTDARSGGPGRPGGDPAPARRPRGAPPGLDHRRPRLGRRRRPAGHAARRASRGGAGAQDRLGRPGGGRRRPRRRGAARAAG